jgi:bis(5'-nucleosyl)-tetraphosphatase (symmetrical)
MALYLIGDVQGCDEALARLVDRLGFSPSRDSLVLLGDLVNRGPASLAVLRRVMAWGDSARCVLGNHDLHLLAVSCGARKLHRNDTFGDVLADSGREQLLDWLRSRPLALSDTWQGRPLLMVHAGVLPSWTVDETLGLAAEVEAVLRSDDCNAFLHAMYGDRPDRWNPDLQGLDRWRVIVNALTRLRFCSKQGWMEFDTKEGAAEAPAGFMPWFEVPSRRSADAIVAFGHWSTLGWLDRDNLLSLDSGCVWGGCLSAVRLDAAAALERIQVRCEPAQPISPPRSRV